MPRPSSEPGSPPAAPAGGPLPYTPAADGVRLRVHVSPRASRERIGEVVTDGRTARLRLAVTAPPHEGEANAAALRLLARALGLPKSALSVAAGHTSREKTIAIRGDAASLSAGIEALLATEQEGRR